MSEPASGCAIELREVTRRFGSFTAVDAASVSLAPGAIHAIVGENGAGKSTLLKMAAGVLAPSSGAVLIDGARLVPTTAAEAVKRGVGMVHQHFMLVGAFRAIENVILGSEPVASLGRLDLDRAATRVRALMESARLAVPLEAKTASLTVGERQRLEILRVLYRGARALILDEPTAVLSPLEADELYVTLRKLADGGATVAVVTHRLDEVSRHADHITVMRRGRVALSRVQSATSRASLDDLTRAIMGGDPPPPFAPPPLAEDAPVVLDVEGLSLRGAGARAALDRVDLAVRAGEIVGVAGVEGNGQRELVRALAGLEPEATGLVAIAGHDVSGARVRDRRPFLGVVHEDRHVDGILLDASVADNLVLGELAADDDDEAALVDRRMRAFGVQPPDAARSAGALSGGNQQKIVIARALDRLRDAGSKAAVVLAQPTRGVDVGAAASIHRAIGDAARSGMAIVVVSADLAELRRLSHRIVVLRDGHVVAELPRDASETELGRAMLGVQAERSESHGEPRHGEPRHGEPRHGAVS
jgi:simple sugar transport system ATP-binding protein